MYGSYYNSSSMYFGNYGYYGWGSWYNPIYVAACYKNPKIGSGSTSGSNITAYQNKNYNNANYTYYNPKSSATGVSNNTNNFGTLIRRTFTPSTYYSTSNNNSNSSYNSSYSNPVRVYTPSTSSSTPSTSSSAGGSSGGYSSSGSSSSGGRGSRGN
jgi:uncharacterized membrane protein YgcG